MKHKIINKYTFLPNDKRGDYFGDKHRNGSLDGRGYIQNNYKCEDGKFHTLKEHIVKWIYFNGDIPEGYEIGHNDGNPSNNDLSNLYLCTHKENMNHYLTKKRLSDSKKGKPHNGYKWNQLSKNKIKGKTPWNKGKPMSQEQKDKISKTKRLGKN